MHQESKFLVGLAIFACIGFAACGDDGSSAASENGESSAIVAEESSSSDSVLSSSVVQSSSSLDILSSSSVADSSDSSSSSADTSAAVKGDTSKITYSLKPFDGPLSNPHKGFTVPTGARGLLFRNSNTVLTVP